MLHTGIISSRRALRKTTLPQNKNHHSNLDSYPTILRLTPNLFPPWQLTNFDSYSIEHAPSIRCDHLLQSTAESSHYLGFHTYGRCLAHCHSVSQPLFNYSILQHHWGCVNSTASIVCPQRHPFARIMACHHDCRLDNLTKKMDLRNKN
jgi:hypothetical protein